MEDNSINMNLDTYFHVGASLATLTWLTETAYKDSGNLLKPYGTHNSR